MKRDFSLPTLDLDGQPIRAGSTVEGMTRAIVSAWPQIPEATKVIINTAFEKECGKEITLASACIGALLGVYDDERGKLDDDTALDRTELARKIHKGGVVDVALDDLTMIKPLIGKKYAGPLVRAVVAEMLEQEAAEPLKTVK